MIQTFLWSSVRLMHSSLSSINLIETFSDSSRSCNYQCHKGGVEGGWLQALGWQRDGALWNQFLTCLVLDEEGDGRQVSGSRICDQNHAVKATEWCNQLDGEQNDRGHCYEDSLSVSFCSHPSLNCKNTNTLQLLTRVKLSPSIQHSRLQYFPIKTPPVCSSRYSDGLVITTENNMSV